jgi:hypothetical protein
LPYAETFDKTLIFHLFDYDRFSKHDQIGEVSQGTLTDGEGSVQMAFSLT